MNIIANFHDDFTDIILKEIDILKKMGFIFAEYSTWKANRINFLQKRIEDKKSKGEDYTYESGNLGEKVLKIEYRRDMVHHYFNLKNKIPERIPRKILKCTSFKCPKILELGLSMLENKIINGEDLLPYLSRKIFNPVFSDYMFYDFGLTHFHLGIDFSKKYPILIEGTKEIVYALIIKDICYFIRIDEHGKWDDISLLEELKKDFPTVLDPWKISGVPMYKPTKDERKKLFQSNINTYIEIGGENYMSLGMGVNTVGTSMTAVMIMDNCFHYLKRIENKIRQIIENNLIQIEKDLEIKLQDMHLVLENLEPIIISDENNKLNICFDPNFEEIIIQKNRHFA